MTNRNAGGAAHLDRALAVAGDGVFVSGEKVGRQLGREAIVVARCTRTRISAPPSRSNQRDSRASTTSRAFAAKAGSPLSKAALREHLAAYMRAWNRNPTPFAWTKPAHAIIRSHRQMIERISTAVH